MRLRWKPIATHPCSVEAVWIPAKAGIHWFCRRSCRLSSLTGHGCIVTSWKEETTDGLIATCGRQYRRRKGS